MLPAVAPARRPPAAFVDAGAARVEAARPLCRATPDASGLRRSATTGLAALAATAAGLAAWRRGRRAQDRRAQRRARAREPRQQKSAAGGGAPGDAGGAGQGWFSGALVVVWLAFFSDYALMTMAIPIFPSLHRSDVLVGILFAAKAVCQVLASPAILRCVDRGAKRTLLGGLLLQLLSTCTFAGARHYAVWLLARGLSGAASAAIISAGRAQLVQSYPDREQRAIAMGLATTGILTGVCLGPLLGGVLFEASPSAPFLALAALQVLLLGLGGLCLPAALGGGGEQDPRDEVAVTGLLRRGEVLRPLGALVLANAAISSLNSTVARHLEAAFGFSPSQVGVVFLLSSVPSCLASAVAGPIGNRVGLARLMQVGLVCQGLFTMLGPKTWLPLQLLSLAGLGVGMGIIDGGAPPLLGEIAEDHFGGTGKIFVLSNVAVQFGFFLGPVVGGTIAAVGGFDACCVATGAALVMYAPFVAAHLRRRPEDAGAETPIKGP